MFTQAANTPPYSDLDPLLVPDKPYAKGGHHFSNGATWVEQFARPLGLAGNTRPAFQGSSDEANNFAVGGARAREVANNAHLPNQVNAFLLAFNGNAPPDGLYVIEMGSNDVRDAFVEYASGGDGGPILQAALTANGNNIVALYATGARRFLVWNVPDIGMTPALLSLGPEAAWLGSYVTTSFNS